MNLLLIGSGGREHALAWKLAQSPRVARIFAAPGNGGTASTPKCENIAIPGEDLPGLRRFAQENNVGLTVVGPEAPLVAGLVDVFGEAALPVFGPTKAAARLEGSKAFAKAFMDRHQIPTAWARTFTDFNQAATFVSSLEHLPVIKASGLAAGKGVLLPESREEALEQLQEIMIQRRFGDAGETVLIEERLQGPELSVLAFCDGATARIMPAAQDHKRLLDGDRGPNTGGMGAFAPSPLATPALLEEVAQRILQPTLAGMAAEGTPYRGVLYAGLMLTAEGPKVLEFNCRFGDPETQVILPLLTSDLLDLIEASIHGHLASVRPTWADRCAVTVVMASGGYPEAYEKGKPITGLEEATAAGALVFLAGAKQGPDGRMYTDGGRVLAVTGLGDDFPAAIQTAYAGVEKIQFEGAIWRRDIGRSLIQAAG